MSIQKFSIIQSKFTKTILVRYDLKFHQAHDGSFDIFFHGSPGGWSFVFSADQKLLHCVHRSAYGVGKFNTNEKNNWKHLKDRLHEANQRKELPGFLRKFLLWKFEPQDI
jgi:hypothetical protein